MGDLREVVAAFKSARYGRFLEDGSFQDVSVVSLSDDDCRWVGGKHDGQVADAVLAAIRKDHAIVERVGEDAVDAVIEEAISAFYKTDGTFSVSLGAAARAMAPIIAVHARDAALEEAIRIVQQYSHQQKNVVHEPTGTTVWDSEQIRAACADLIGNIRALKSGGPAHD